ncbi:metal-dependent hydrolase [Candidatus Woesearchaeota archaeon]|nr:metal-dependent hydrolase [Candidatus Woesearchaeota archaeon]
MPFAVTHVLLAIIAVDLYRDYFAKHKKYFTLHTVFIAGFAGLLPDIDIPLNWILNLFGAEIVHRTITHTPLFGLIFLIPAFILWSYKKHKIALYFFVTTFGILLHLFLDYTFVVDAAGGIMFFYPFSTAVYGLNLLQNVSVNMFAAMDAAILLLWLWHEEMKHKISDFI